MRFSEAVVVVIVVAFVAVAMLTLVQQLQIYP